MPVGGRGRRCHSVRVGGSVGQPVAYAEVKGQARERGRGCGRVGEHQPAGFGRERDGGGIEGRLPPGGVCGQFRAQQVVREQRTECEHPQGAQRLGRLPHSFVVESLALSDERRHVDHPAQALPQVLRGVEARCEQGVLRPQGLYRVAGQVDDRARESSRSKSMAMPK